MQCGVHRYRCTLISIIFHLIYKINFLSIMITIFVFILSVLGSSGTPFIFEENIQYCTLDMHTDERTALRTYIETNSTTNSLKTEQEQIYFKLCGKFNKNDKCPEGAVACTKDYKSKSEVNFGTHFELLKNGDLVSKNGDNCSEGETYKLFVHLDSESNYPKFVAKTKNCSYNIKAPAYEKSSKCGMTMNGRYLDLSSLAGNYTTHGKGSQYKITLCNRETQCDGNVNACKKTGNNSEELSETDSVNIFYMGAKNEMSFHGSFRKKQSKKITSKIEVILKCDWDKKFIDKEKDLKYVEKPTQGKLYTFELETSFGCIKKPISCKLEHEFLMYDLTNLNNHIVWSTRHGDDMYFVQLCKPIELSTTNMTCKGTYAQVCKNSNGKDVNMGSVLTQLESYGHSLRATIDRGGRCQKGIQHKSIIDFTCGEETGPNFDHGDESGSCTSYFKWTTPAACPRYNPASCRHIHQEQHQCSFIMRHNIYDLKALSATQTIQDQRNPEMIYKFNICGSVIDDDVPCMKDVSVIMKNNSEMNVLNKVKSLGKFHDSFLKDGALILEFATGAFCSEGGDYQSEIRMECSNIDENPQLLAQEHCVFHFVWKTKHACPQYAKESSILGNLISQKCLLKDYETSETINLADPKLLEIVDEKYKYMFSVCGEFYLNCSLETKDCLNIQSDTKELTTSTGSATFNLTFPTTCHEALSDNFNVVIINFVCPSIENNDHFESWKIQDCQLTLSYATDAVCSIEGRKKELNMELVRNENCTIHSPFTGYEMNLQNFTTTFLRKNCPTVKYNSTFKFVQLLYDSDDKCIADLTNNVSYELVLECLGNYRTQLHQIPDNDCNIHLRYQEKEYCNFFKSLPEPTSSALAVAGITMTCLGAIAIVVGAAIAFRKGKCNFLRIRNVGAFYESVRPTGSYERDAQL